MTNRAAIRLSAMLWARRADPVRAGYWLARARVGPRGTFGPLCPAAIIVMHTKTEPGAPNNRMERSPFFAAFFAGEPIDIWSLRPATHTAGSRIIRLERAIDEAEYRYRCAELAWATRYAPHEPIANPHKALDHLQTPILF